jgi:hypothetical protein
MIMFMFGVSLVNNDEAEARMHFVGLVRAFTRTAMFSWHPDVRDGHGLSKDVDSILDLTISLSTPRASSLDQYVGLMAGDDLQLNDLLSESEIRDRFPTAPAKFNILDRLLLEQSIPYRSHSLLRTEIQSVFRAAVILSVLHYHKLHITMLQNLVYLSLLFPAVLIGRPCQPGCDCKFLALRECVQRHSSRRNQLHLTTTNTTMPLIVPDLVEPKSASDSSKAADKPKDEPKTESKGEEKDAQKRFDGSKAPGMEGMSPEAMRKFEEAMELEYQKREGGA